MHRSDRFPGCRVRRVLAALLFCVAGSACADVEPDPFFELARAYVVEVDDTAIWARHADDPLPPASLTKLMTALLVAEAGGLDDTVTVSTAAASATGSRLGLRTGDRLHVPDLLAATLVASANDACRALAEWRDGTEARFVERMNERARQLGMAGTRFRNACGHDAPGHESTANDLARLARAAMQVPAIAALVKLTEGEIATADGRRHFRFDNRNALVGRYEGAVGVKSGYTPGAGKCVIALARRGAHRVLLVLLNAPDRWWTAHALLDRAFAHAASPSSPAH